LYKLNELKRPKKICMGLATLSTLAATWLFEQGCINPRLQVTVTNEVCAVVPHIFGFWVCQPSGTKNCEVASRFFENLCTLALDLPPTFAISVQLNMLGIKRNVLLDPKMWLRLSL
jgi:hypothetical protein